MVFKLFKFYRKIGHEVKVQVMEDNSTKVKREGESVICLCPIVFVFVIVSLFVLMMENKLKEKVKVWLKGELNNTQIYPVAFSRFSFTIFQPWRPSVLYPFRILDASMIDEVNCHLLQAFHHFPHSSLNFLITHKIRCFIVDTLVVYFGAKSLPRSYLS